MLTDVLSREHEIVMEHLTLLEQAIGRTYVPGNVAKVLTFFDEVMVKHRRKEEEHLFPALAAHFPPESGPVACMLEEHRDEKEHVEALRQAMVEDDRDRVRLNARYIIDLLRNHIAKEDNVLFPMAEQLLSSEAKGGLARGFESIGTFAPTAACRCGDAKKLEV